VTLQPEILARRRGRCKVCNAPILPGEHYVAKLDRLGWVHVACATGYRRVLAEHAEEQ
jgi:RNase P subunit RPR2